MDKLSKNKFQTIILNEIYLLKDSVFDKKIPVDTAIEVIKHLEKVYNLIDSEFETEIVDSMRKPSAELYSIVNQGE